VRTASQWAKILLSVLLEIKQEWEVLYHHVPRSIPEPAVLCLLEKN
jgi:hypothetical protein